MESKYNLKPCPFCGAPAHMWKTNYRTWIECSKFEANKHQIEVSGRTEEEAAEAWNRRTQEKGFWYTLEKGEKGYSAGDLLPEQPEPLTDKEQRIFLAAMGREMKVCQEVDRNYTREPYEDSLVRVCREIERKIKDALWT